MGCFSFASRFQEVLDHTFQNQLFGLSFRLRSLQNNQPFSWVLGHLGFCQLLELLWKRFQLMNRLQLFVWYEFIPFAELIHFRHLFAHHEWVDGTYLFPLGRLQPGPFIVHVVLGWHKRSHLLPRNLLGHQLLHLTLLALQLLGVMLLNSDLRDLISAIQIVLILSNACAPFQSSDKAPLSKPLQTKT